MSGVGVSALAALCVSQLLAGSEPLASLHWPSSATDSRYFMTLRDQTLADSRHRQESGLPTDAQMHGQLLLF
jgi:hypothetical protein